MKLEDKIERLWEQNWGTDDQGHISEVTMKSLMRILETAISKAREDGYKLAQSQIRSCPIECKTCEEARRYFLTQDK